MTSHPRGKENARTSIRELLRAMTGDAHLVLTVRAGAADELEDPEVAAFVHPLAKDVEETALAILEAAEEEASEHPGEIRHFRLADDASGESAVFSLGYA